MRGLGLRLSPEREGHEWTAVNANNVEALKEHAPFAVHRRVDLGEIVDVHFAQAPIPARRCVDLASRRSTIWERKKAPTWWPEPGV
jgi:hypothetical protein